MLHPSLQCCEDCLLLINYQTRSKAFEHSCGNNSYQILRSLKFQGDPQNIDSLFAKSKLQTLQSQVRDEYGVAVDFQRRDDEKEPWAQKNKFNEKMLIIGCGLVHRQVLFFGSCPMPETRIFSEDDALVALVAFTLMFVGFATALSWAF